MREPFVKPEIEIIDFDVEDIIVTSTTTPIQWE